MREDVRDGDHTTLSTIPANDISMARCLIKDDGILAGVALAQKIFKKVNPDMWLDLHLMDGTEVNHGDVPFYVEGHTQTILTCERLVLNLMQRMSGIATQTRRYVDLIEGTGCKLLDTRKTTPLIRHMEKWAVNIGGGVNHRFGLYDMIMIKDNHVDYAGGIAQAISSARKYLDEKGLELRIEIETRNLDEVRQVLEVGGVDVIMLDNMEPAMMKEAVQMIGGRFITEGSGGITEETIRAKAETGVDYLSVGALTHSVRSLDISLKAVV